MVLDPTAFLETPRITLQPQNRGIPLSIMMDPIRSMRRAQVKAGTSDSQDRLERRKVEQMS